MNLLLLLVLLIPPSDSFNSLSPHWSDSLRLKCDSLPYRTAAVGTVCYFAVNKQVEYKEAAGLCSSIFPGSRVAYHVPTEVFDAMMVEKSKFHVVYGSAGAKQVMCYDGAYACQRRREKSSFIHGKCVARLDQKQSYLEAEASCRSRGMELLTIKNDVQNRLFRAALGTAPAWIRYSYNGETSRKWIIPQSYGRFGTCEGDSKKRWPASQMQSICSLKLSSVIDSSGYWWNDEQTSLNDVICVKDGFNYFTPEHFKPSEIDTCILETSNIAYRQKEICPRAKNLSHSYVIRAVLEDGSRVTLDNDKGSAMRYDEAKKMWYYHFHDDAAPTFVYFASAVCAVSSGKCPCSTVVPHAIIGKTSPVITDRFGSCPSGMTLWVVYEKYPTGASGLDPATTNVFCNAGVWMVREQRWFYAYAVLGASCAHGKTAPVTGPTPQGVALLEDGSLVTLDNDKNSHVHYDEAKMMWYYHFHDDAAPTFVYFVSAVCAVSSGKCPCPPVVPPAKIGTTSPVITDKFGSCPSGMSLWVVYEKYPTGVSRLDPSTTNVFCNAGVWMVREHRWHYAYTVLGASCA